MQLTLNATSVGRPVSNFWNNFHFHPTDAVEDQWGQRILKQVAADHAAQYVRLYTMFEEFVTVDEKGALVCDFRRQDKRFDLMVAAGYKLLLCFNFMPVDMAADPNTLSGRRYKDQRFCRSIPRDYAQWRELCRLQTAHLVERYGEETVSQWRFHCWNEPDLGFWIYPKFFFECTPEEQEFKITEYCKLYDYFEAGVHAACPAVPVGGPSVGHYKDFFARVMRHVSSEPNYVTGRIGTRIDFVSLHCYSSIPQDIHDPLRYRVAPESIVAQYRRYRAIMAEHGLGDRPVFIDEWAAAAEGYLGCDRDPRMRFRETEFYAAFYFRLIDLMGRLKIPPERMMICLSGQDAGSIDFDGHRTFFTVSGYRKPIYNAFALAARLGETRLPVDGDFAEHTGAVATRRADGAVAVALYRHESDFGADEATEPVRLAVTGLPARFTVRRTRIDALFSNACTAWGRVGCPEHPDIWEREQILRHAELEECRAPEVGGGAWEGETLLTHNSVELIEFIPQQP